MNRHYHDRYHRFISSRAARSIPRGTGIERHHINPRCLGGDDSPGNLIKLTRREHFIAHRLLRRAYPDSHGLQFAFFSMCNSKRYDYRIEERRSRDYEKARAIHSKKSSAKMDGIITRLDTQTGKVVRLTQGQMDSEPDRYAGIMLGQVAMVRLSDEKMVMVSKEEAKDKSKYRHFNTGVRRGAKSNAFVGHWVTPKGRFDTKEDAMRAHAMKSPTGILNRCRVLNAKAITAHALQSNWDLSPEEKLAHVGKTWAEMGWGFRPAIEKGEWLSPLPFSFQLLVRG